jgi:hypothetical protein
MSPLPPIQPAEEFAASLRRALQAAPPAGPALPYCGLGDVGCNGKSPSCACLDYLFECDPTAGTCSPMTVGMAVLVVGALVLLWLCCSKEDEDGYEPIDSGRGGRGGGGGGGGGRSKSSKSKSKKDKKGKKGKKSKSSKVAYIDDR